MRARWLGVAALAVVGATPVFGALPQAGASVVGTGLLPGANELVIGPSGGNDVVQVLEGESPTAYGGGTFNIVNACSIGAAAFADVGAGTGHFSTKKHQYDFSFVPGLSVNAFSVTLLDWGDFLPFGTNPDDRYEVLLTAYDADGAVIDVDTEGFTSTGSSISNRISEEYGALSVAGDACDATLGQPGRLPLSVSGAGIVQVTFRFRDMPSMDPHVALYNVQYVIEQPPEGVHGTGHWKTHSDWPVSSHFLGNTEYTQAQLVAVLKTAPAGDMTYVLAHFLIAAKLNAAARNESDCVSETINSADLWLAEHPIGSSVKANSDAWKTAGAALASLLEQYCEGELCAPSAD